MEPIEQSGYFYHATNVDNAFNILSLGRLVPHKPWYGTNQSVWPDETTENRSYFGPNPRWVIPFYPEYGQPILLRVPKSCSNFKKERHTQDIYTNVSINVKFIDFWNEKIDEWLPLEKLKGTTIVEEMGMLKNKIINVYVDMDGVLAHFDKALEQNNVQVALKKKWQDTLKKHHKEDILKLPKDEIKKLFKGPQDDPVMKDLKKVWHGYNNHGYVVANTPGFFLNLEEMPGARELLQLVHDLTGKLPHILTAPIESNPLCEKEKHQWVQNHFGGMWDEFHCTAQKSLYAAPNSILIDDRSKYLAPWQANGGVVVLYKNFSQAAKELEQQVMLLKSKTETELIKEFIHEVVVALEEKRCNKLKMI